MEVFIEDAYEFTAIVLDVGSGSVCHPVVLMPTEVITFFSYFLRFTGACARFLFCSEVLTQLIYEPLLHELL